MLVPPGRVVARSAALFRLQSLGGGAPCLVQTERRAALAKTTIQYCQEVVLNALAGDTRNHPSQPFNGQFNTTEYQLPQKYF